ncbi:hypothetical protein [Paenibacillus tengchongensis]|uniref:hypothetical protein n=1 Tax=Paenibacillus tengchongensis TaxID=2608684 RepID=UPI001FE662F6|nr:hypothetical protein [Paenibacillus tengchongensis]
MILNKIKPGRWMRRLLYAGLGILLFGAGWILFSQEEDREPEYVSVPADEMVTIPWNFGWTPAISVTPGIPFELQGHDETLYEVAGDSRYLCVEEGERFGSLSKADNVRQAGERFYWSFICGNSVKQLNEVGTSWISIVRKEEGAATGLVLVRISPPPDTPENKDKGPIFTAEIIASLAFPRQGGTYQPVSRKALKAIEAEYKERFP